MALVLIVNLLKQNLKPDHIVCYNQAENNTAIMLFFKKTLLVHSILWIICVMLMDCRSDAAQHYYCI